MEERLLTAFPHVDWKAAFVIEYALPYQPTSLTVPKWPVIFGMAVEMIVESRAARKMLKINPRVRRMNLRPVGYCSSDLVEAFSRTVEPSLEVFCNSTTSLAMVQIDPMVNVYQADGIALQDSHQNTNP